MPMEDHDAAESEYYDDVVDEDSEDLGEKMEELAC